MDGLGTALTMLVTTPIVPAAIVGLVWGMVGGAIPGISSSIAMALILPLTFTLSPVSGIVILAATYIGSEYGASIPAILIRTPASGSAPPAGGGRHEMKPKGR